MQLGKEGRADALKDLKDLKDLKESENEISSEAALRGLLEEEGSS